MKKFFITILFAVVCFTGCGPSETEVRFTNEDNLEKTIFDECVNSLKDQLKDPSSLKFDTGCIVAYEVSLENAVKCTINYELDKLLNKGETETVKYFNELNSYIVNIYDANINDCKYYIVPTKFYGKNSYGAYASDYINVIVVVFPISIDKYGIVKYEGTTWEGDYLNKYCKIHDVSSNTVFIDIPDNMKL